MFVNGGIYTVDAERGWAEAAAVRGNQIIAVGRNAEIEDLIGPDTRLVDLTGRMAMPGIHDSHVHPLEGGYDNIYCNLWDAASPEAVTEQLRRCAETLDGDWLNAAGLDLGMFDVNGPDKSLLDGVAPGKYIFADGSDGHSALVNDQTLALAGFGEQTEDPHDGVIERRPGSREPNGTVRESARDIIDKLRPPRDLRTSLRAMALAIEEMNSHGITSGNDVWVGELEMQVYKTLDERGELTLRVLGSIIDEGVFEKHVGEDFERVLASRADYASRLLSFDSIKIMVDGVFEGETGGLLYPYENTDNLGAVYNESELPDRVKRYHDMGLRVHFHTMGDRAARVALDAIERARESGSESHRSLVHTLSHLGLVDPADLPRFAELNVGASFTPVWGYTDEWTLSLEIPVIGRDRVARLYPMRSVQAAGGRVLGGSDWNYGDLDPLLSIETAITRENPSEPSDYEVFADETVDLATMIDAYTRHGAWQLGREHELGSIEIGKLADLVVYDRNLFAIPPSEISEALVDLTIFDGEIVYERGGTP